MSDTKKSASGYLEPLFDAARAAVQAAQAPVTTQGDRQKLIVPEGYRLEDVTDKDRLAAHAAAAIVLDEKQALIDYVNRFREPGSVLFADADKSEVRCVLDYHLASNGEDATTGARQHKATLKLRDSEEFQRWNAIAGQLVTQEVFADFLEENANDIASPDPAAMIDLARDLSASVGATFRSKVDLQSGDRVFNYARETTVDEKIVVPKIVELEIPLYQGEQPMRLRMAFRYSLGGGGLRLGVEWRRVQYQRLALFKEIAFAVAEGTGVPVFVGRET